MQTRVFISWSGELSRRLGDELRIWLPNMLQHVRPYFTPVDIEKGAKWNAEITKELENTKVGIICLTRYNTEKPWIHFEAGALSKSVEEESHVCTLLFNIETTDVKGPLKIFQATRFLREDFKRLVTTINNASGAKKLKPAGLKTKFDKCWPQLEEKVSKILESHGEYEEGLLPDKKTQSLINFWQPFSNTNGSIIYTEYLPMGNDQSMYAGKLLSDCMFKALNEFRYIENLINLKLTHIGSQTETGISNNQIILGGPTSNFHSGSMFNILNKKFGKRVRFEKDENSNKYRIEFNDKIYVPDMTENNGTDYAILLKANYSSDAEQVVVIAAGCNKYGTWGAAKAACDPKIISKITKRKGASANMVAVLQVRVRNGYPWVYDLHHHGRENVFPLE